MPTLLAVPTFAELLEFAKSCEGVQFETLARRKPFNVLVQADELYFRPLGQPERRSQTTRVNALLAKLLATGSMKPCDYSEETFNASYLMTLVEAWQSRVSDGPTPASTALAPPHEHVLTGEQKVALKSVVDAAVKSYFREVGDDPFDRGIFVDLLAPERHFGAAVYWTGNNAGNDVEVVFSVGRVFNEDGPRAVRWIEATVARLRSQIDPSDDHIGLPDGHLSAGFKFADAIHFFSEVAKQTDPDIPVENRWILDFDATPASERVSRAEGAGAPTREAGSLDHMLTMAKQACRQSGEVRTAVAKAKAFLFEDDAHFRVHVAELLERQENRCAVTNLHL